jgi:hypothetical protein
MYCHRKLCGYIAVALLAVPSLGVVIGNVPRNALNSELDLRGDKDSSLYSETDEDILTERPLVVEKKRDERAWITGKETGMLVSISGTYDDWYKDNAWLKHPFIGHRSNKVSCSTTK